MSGVPEDSFSIDPMMLDLFKVELETQVKILTKGLLAIEKEDNAPADFEPLMRAAHSLKGAGRIVRMEPLIRLAHTLEDTFVAAQKGEIAVSSQHIDILLSAVDLFSKLAAVPPKSMSAWIQEEESLWNISKDAIHRILTGAPPMAEEEAPHLEPKEIENQEKPKCEKIKSQPFPLEAEIENEKNKTYDEEERILRVTAQNLNRLMGFAGEALVESRWLQPFYKSLQKTRKLHLELSDYLTLTKEACTDLKNKPRLSYFLHEVIALAEKILSALTQHLADLEEFIIRNTQLSTRLYGEVIDSRMRPFSDCTQEFPRMVRDLSKQLKKKVKLVISGKNTPVDRDILDKLEAPLGHLLRNAVDHGIESPEERLMAGKPSEGKIQLEAQHRAGMLFINLSDDGRGVDLEKLRIKIVEKKLVKADVAKDLSENELLEFLLLPGFSTAQKITEISGRGVGLNVVQNMVQGVGGEVRIIQKLNKGTSFLLQLPLTLSVIRALIVEIAGDPYAFPLGRIDKVLELNEEDIEIVEGRQYCLIEGQNIGLILAAQVLEMEENEVFIGKLPVVVFSDRNNVYGIVVNKFVGQRELVVHELDARLKKIPDVSAASLLEDGSPIVILDVEDMVRSIDRLLNVGRLLPLEYSEEMAVAKHKKILVVDDSITVREVEARLLRNRGYIVDTAVNGMDGWNAVRAGEYDLVITDIDMPRMNGIELLRAIRADSRLKNIPVMIVSYKEREEDKMLGLEAGANGFLAKSSFHDEALIDKVIDLIGK